MKAKRWMIAEPDAGGVRRLAQEMHCAPLTAAVLSARGIENAAAARAFLSCALYRWSSCISLAISMESLPPEIHTAIRSPG